MAILDMDGKPVASKNNSYTPARMLVNVALVNKITEQPELSFQIMIPFEQFEFYMDNPETFTLTIHNFVGYAYGTQILEDQEPTNEKIREWLEEAAKKYSIAVSEPLASDAIFQDTATPANYAKKPESEVN